MHVYTVHIHAYTYINMYPCTHQHMLTQTQTQLLCYTVLYNKIIPVIDRDKDTPHIHTSVHTYTHTYICLCMYGKITHLIDKDEHACMHVQVHVRQDHHRTVWRGIHTYTHIYTYIHVQVHVRQDHH